MIDLPSDWKILLHEEQAKAYYLHLQKKIQDLRSVGITIYPEDKEVFSAFAYTPFTDVKVVIVGQDPYHGPGQAHGLAFSVKDGINIPPSLKNIFKELNSDLHIAYPASGSLIPWARQGVLLLNSTLTVEKGRPHSHHNLGWEMFTDAVIQKLVARKDPLIFLLWGKSAEKKAEAIARGSCHHHVLHASHPSPYSAKGFFGCRHFSQVNDILQSWHKSPIDWSLS